MTTIAIQETMVQYDQTMSPLATYQEEYGVLTVDELIGNNRGIGVNGKVNEYQFARAFTESVRKLNAEYDRTPAKSCDEIQARIEASDGPVTMFDLANATDICNDILEPYIEKVRKERYELTNRFMESLEMKPVGNHRYI